MRAATTTAAVIAVFAIALAVPSMAAIGSIVNVNLAKYDPFPVEAGKTTTVYIDVINSGQESASNVTVTLEPKYPFSLPSNDPERTIPVIPGGDSRRIEYNVLADVTAKNGTYPLTVSYVQDGAETSKDFSVTVRETQSFDRADIVPLYVGVTPAPYPGVQTKLSVDITNVDKGTAYYVIARASSSAFTIDRSEIFVGTLEPNDFDSIDFDMVTNNVAPGTYPVNITAIYKDHNSNEIEQTMPVYVTVISAQAARQLETAPTPAWAYVLYLVLIILVVKFVAMPLWKRYRRKH